MTRRIHIQHLLLSLQEGGLENGVVNVINGLDRTRFVSSVCCLQQSGVFSARILCPDVTIYEMGLENQINLKLVPRLMRLFRNTRIDLLHTHNARALYYGILAAKLAGVRTVVHSEHGRKLPDRAGRMLAQRCLLRFTTAVFAVSAQLKRDLVEHVRIPSDRLAVVNNCVDVERMARGDRDTARQTMGVQPAHFVIGSVGRLVAVKNHALLLRAVSGMTIRDQVRIVLVGRGPEQERLQVLAEDLALQKQVCLMGYREDIADLLAGMDIFVLPSLSEGMSNALLEAMAAARPVVASNVGGNPEVIQDMRDGLLFTSQGERCLRERLEWLAADADWRVRLGRAAQERMRRDFSMAAMIRNYERLYERGLNKAGRLYFKA